MSTRDQTLRWRHHSVAALGVGMPVMAGLVLIESGWLTGFDPHYFLGVIAGSVIVFLTIQRAHESYTGAVPSRVTMASRMTVLRGSAIALLAGFLLIDPPSGSGRWLPVVLFTVAAGFDGVDGWLARVRGTTSALGRHLDEGIDEIVVLVGSVVLVIWGSAHVIFLLSGLAKYAFLGGIAVRRRRGKPVTALDSRWLRKVIVGVLLLAMWIAFLPLTDPRIGRIVTTIALVPFLLYFARDYLVVSARL